MGFHPKPRKGATPPSPHYCGEAARGIRVWRVVLALASATSIVVPCTAVPTGCSIALAALPLATAVSLPRCGSLCRYAATGHRPKGRASQISDLSRAIPSQRAELGVRILRTPSPPASLRASFRLTPPVRFALRASAHRAHANLHPHLGLRPKPHASSLARGLFLVGSAAPEKGRHPPMPHVF